VRAFIDCHTDGKTWALLFDPRPGHDINIWFNVSQLTLNLNKTLYIEFITKIIIMSLHKLNMMRKL